LPVSSAREHLADVVNQAAYAGVVTYITRRGQRVAAVVPTEVADRNDRPAVEPVPDRSPTRRIGFAALGEATDGRTARDSDDLLADGFGRS
jgi:prevent-host-death family protein